MLVKIILGLNLIGYAAHRQAGAEQREKEDTVNDFGRDPIGEGAEERVRIPPACAGGAPNSHSRPQLYNKELKTLLNQARDDAVPTAEIGERVQQKGADGGGGGGGGKKRLKLEDLTRFTMVKRIW